jgi:hypothetical protein
MSLGIFSIDLAAIIRSLSDFVTLVDPSGSPANMASAIDQFEGILQDAADSEKKIDDVLIAAALEQTITSVMASAVDKTKNPEPLPVPAKPVQSHLDDETRLEIERLIRSLQTSVVHNYRSSDIIDETVSLERVQRFPRRRENEDTDVVDRRRAEDRRRDELRMQSLREEFKREMLRNNSAV